MACNGGSGSHKRNPCGGNMSASQSSSSCGGNNSMSASHSSSSCGGKNSSHNLCGGHGGVSSQKRNPCGGGNQMGGGHQMGGSHGIGNRDSCGGGHQMGGLHSGGNRDSCGGVHQMGGSHRGGNRDSCGGGHQPRHGGNAEDGGSHGGFDEEHGSGGQGLDCVLTLSCKPSNHGGSKRRDGSVMGRSATRKGHGNRNADSCNNGKGFNQSPQGQRGRTMDSGRNNQHDDHDNDDMEVHECLLICTGGRGKKSKDRGSKRQNC